MFWEENILSSKMAVHEFQIVFSTFIMHYWQ